MSDYPRINTTAYLFDIDGVLTNPNKNDVVNPQLIPLFVTKLNEGHVIGLISGRPLSWEITEVVEKMERYVAENSMFDPIILDNLFVSGEFGGSVAIHSGGGRREIVYQEYAIPKELIPKLEQVVIPFQELVAFDPAKLTHFTVFANNTTPVHIFREQAKQIVPLLKKVVEHESSLEVHEDRIAINVKNKLANKRVATAQFLRWLSEKGIESPYIYAFGDSVSDLDIGKELHVENIQFTFIFVGEKEIIVHEQLPFPVVFTEKHFDEGTIDFLNKLQN